LVGVVYLHDCEILAAVGQSTDGAFVVNIVFCDGVSAGRRGLGRQVVRKKIFSSWRMVAFRTAVKLWPLAVVHRFEKRFICWNVH